MQLESWTDQKELVSKGGARASCRRSLDIESLGVSPETVKRGECIYQRGTKIADYHNMEFDHVKDSVHLKRLLGLID